MLRLLVAAAAGYAAARYLIEHEPPEALPEPLRARLLDARTALLAARDLAREALTVARLATREAERELMAEYHARAGRTP